MKYKIIFGLCILILLIGCKEKIENVEDELSTPISDTIIKGEIQDNTTTTVEIHTNILGQTWNESDWRNIGCMIPPCDRYCFQVPCKDNCDTHCDLLVFKDGHNETMECHTQCNMTYCYDCINHSELKEIKRINIE